MAEIYRANYSGIEGFAKELVIKRLREEFALRPTVVQMFLDEARIAAQLSHPNVVGIVDVGQVEGAYYLAMEYVHGVDLHEMLRSFTGTVMPLQHALTVATALCAALEYVHARCDLDGRHLGLVHRDVSPSNVLLNMLPKIATIENFRF